MRNSFRTFVDVFRAAAMQFSATGAAFLAQAIAFNMFFAAIPLSLVIVAMFGYIFGTETGDMRALDTIDQFAPQFYDSSRPTSSRSCATAASPASSV